MRISHRTNLRTARTSGTNGFGYATNGVLDSLVRLGYHVEANDTSADVELIFDQPHNIEFSDSDAYKVFYFPWESTQLIEGWAERLNKADEVWTPSPLIASWMPDMGITRPVFVYEHGIDHIWVPRRREGGTKFLHVGAEATRKGGWDTLRAFRKAFPHNKDVSFTMKVINSNWNKLDRVGRTSIINAKYSFDQLYNLFYDHHIYVYPSWGEGFGLTPLQALGSGMPTICTAAWAPYERFLDPRLSVSSKMVLSPWQRIHPGNMLRPDMDEVVEMMRAVAADYDSYADVAMRNAEKIHAEYDWDSITSKVFSDLEKRLK